MRRKDREVTDKKEIIGILRRCDTVHIGMQGEKYPYVVPVSFGVDEENGETAVYFHCAKQGLKTELLRRSASVCVEGDVFMGVQKTEHGITARYESVIGFGKCSFAEEPEEIIKGLRLILEHYGQTDHPIDRCRGLQNMDIGRIVLESISGKRNLPDAE